MENKVYTKPILGAELILKLEEGNFSPEKIANWADYIYNKNIGEDDEVDTIIQNLGSMSFGPEFEMTEKELRDLAISLINSSSNKDTNPKKI